MASLKNIFGGSYKPKPEHQETPENQFKMAMEREGLNAPINLITDGELHRFSQDDKRSKTGWYIYFDDKTPAGRFGDWKTGLDQTFRTDTGVELTVVERMEHSRRMADAKEARDKAKDKKHEVAKETAQQIWDSLGDADDSHPYLKTKGISHHGVRATGDGRLCLPLYNPEGSISTLQFIDANGGKQFLSGGKTGGAFWVIGETSGAPLCYIAEGFATCATIHEETGAPVFVSFSAHNLTETAKSALSFSGAKSFIIVGDNDKSKTGQIEADRASKSTGIIYVIPPDVGDINDFRASGGDVMGLLAPKKADEWLVSADEFCAQPAPIKWLIKGWLQEEALHMLHGPSGSGKTFAVLDMILRIGSKKEEWQGHKSKDGPVVYLAGEGHNGLRGRIAGWKQENSVDALSLWLSKSGLDLNTPEGYLKTHSQINSLPVKPSMIVVDTLHRFLEGDENSSIDAKTMIVACGELMREFKCAVMLVHHTGVSADAQGRGRGSSAWKGALDIEINITPGKNKGDPSTLRQVKSKDSDLQPDKLFTLESIKIDGWFDEDNEPVTTAVYKSSSKVVVKKEDEHLARVLKAWELSGSHMEDGNKIVNKKDILNYLIFEECMAEQGAKQQMKPSVKGKLVNVLLEKRRIKEFNRESYIVVGGGNLSNLRVPKSGDKI